MAIKGETIASGASDICRYCGEQMSLRVLRSAAGFYIGTWCCMGPYSRESGYFPTRKSAQEALDTDFLPRGALH